MHGRKGGLVRDLIADSESFRPASQGGRLQSEWVADFRRNRWPDCVGISGRLSSDYAPSSLRIKPRSVRTHSRRQIRQIADSIEAHGFIGAIAIDEHDVVLAGVGRLKASQLFGMGLVPTIKVTGLSDPQKRTFAIADNKLCENAGWDRQMLMHELGELCPLLEPLGWDLTLTGFAPAELDLLFGELDDGTDADEAAVHVADGVVPGSAIC